MTISLRMRDTKDRIWNAIRNIREKEGLRKEISDLKQQVKKRYDFTMSIIGNSPSMKKVFAMIEKAVKSNITVLSLERLEQKRK